MIPDVKMILGSCRAIAFLVSCSLASAADFSFSGAITQDDQLVTFSFSISSPSTVVLHSLGYAGGMNAAGHAISAGGFDPTFSIFDSSGALVAVDNDGSCGTVVKDPTTGNCFDSYLSLTLAPGTYTLGLTESDNKAVGPKLSDGFTKMGQGNFTCPEFLGTVGAFCDISPAQRNGNWAVDIRNADSAAITGGVPQLGADQIVNAASFRPGPLAPGTLFTIFAASLGGTTASAPGTPWPVTLGGVSLTVGGVQAPLIYVSPTQINAQLPYESTPGTQPLILTINGQSFPSVPLTIVATSPGLFVALGRAAALNQDYSVNTASNRAPAGTVISAYFTGAGAANPAVTTGAAAPLKPLSYVSPTTATIGGQPADLLFSGLTPTLVGVAQANVRVPSLTAGDYPLVLIMGNTTTNAGSVSVGASK